MKFGLIVNPIAGLGGSVGLKGTDGPDTVARALQLGAVAHAGERTHRAMTIMSNRAHGTVIKTGPDELGADWLKGLNFQVETIKLSDRSHTARDTRELVSAMLDIDLIVFAGGDGTARDVASRLGQKQAMLGIPCGVKMHSGVFAVSPEAAGALLGDMAVHPNRVLWDDHTEVMDIDEAALRAGRLAPKLYDHARTPLSRNRIQASKGGPRRDWGVALVGAASEIAENMDPETLYIIGPGTSAGAVAKALGIESSILGIDAVLGGELVASDANSDELEAAARGRSVQIILGVTGRQGFLLGRGNQQIGPELIKRAGRDGLIVIATEDKLAALARPRLWIDTDDPELDKNLAGFLRVKTARGREMVMRVMAN